MAIIDRTEMLIEWREIDPKIEQELEWCKIDRVDLLNFVKKQSEQLLEICSSGSETKITRVVKNISEVLQELVTIQTKICLLDEIVKQTGE